MSRLSTDDQMQGAAVKLRQAEQDRDRTEGKIEQWSECLRDLAKCILLATDFDVALNLPGLVPWPETNS
jgi:hypothetical protein